MKRRSWKTTLGGMLTAVGLGMGQMQEQLPSWGGWVAQLLTIIGPVILGYSARDNNVTSEEAGAVKK